MKIEEIVNELYESDKTVSQIAKELQIPRQEVRGYLRKRDKPKKSEKKDQREQRKGELIEKVKELYLGGKQQKEIAKELKMPTSTVHYYIYLLRNKSEVPESQTERMKERREKVKKLYYIEEKKVMEIAKILQVSDTTIRIDIQRLDIMAKKGQTQEKSIKEIVENDYMNECRKKIKNKTLEKEELEFIRKISETTRSYGHEITYIRACILFSQMQEAKNELKYCIENEEFTRTTKKKI